MQFIQLAGDKRRLIGIDLRCLLTLFSEEGSHQLLLAVPLVIPVIQAGVIGGARL